jgi:uncharacterized membrane protein YhaH (DUF805 family)
MTKAREFWDTVLLLTILFFPFGLVFLMDILLKPQMKSGEDEGIYIGMLLFAILVEVAIISIVFKIIDLVRWFKKKYL